MKPLFSKTGFQKGLQCKKALYLYKYHPKLKDPLPAERLERFNRGHEIGFKARALFPGGYDLQPEAGSRPTVDLPSTRRAIEQGHGVLYEPAFLHQRVIVYNDILVRRPEGWDLYEVKSSRGISETYITDLALQAYVVAGSGLPLLSCSIIHLRKGIDEITADDTPTSIFTITDLTDTCRSRFSAIEKEIHEMQILLSTRRIPDIRTGVHCHHPYPCTFFGFCSRPEQAPDIGLFASPQES